MKLKNISFAALSALTLAGSAHAVMLFSDSFDTYTGWDAAGVAADQSGTYDGTGYTSVSAVAEWNTHSSDLNQPLGTNSLKVDTGAGISNVSINRNFAPDANLADLPLSISYFIQTAGGNSHNWASFNLGSVQGATVNSASTKFGTQYFVGSTTTTLYNAGTNLFEQGTVDYNLATGSTVTLVFSDTAGTGSAFDGASGSKVAFYVENTLVDTFTLGQLTASDGYLTVESNFTRAIVDNLAVQTIPEPSAALLGGLGMLALLRRRR